MSNTFLFGYDEDLLGTAGKRGTEYSQGSDVCSMKSTSASELRRQTNVSGTKLIKSFLNVP
jgi:hypothetical protein